MKKYLLWLVTIFVPVVLVLAAVRILLTPIFIQLEYRMPYFPDDSYGFSFEERLHWANISRVYMLNAEGIEFLGDQKLDQETPLYNERELKHMLDVKIVIRWAMGIMWFGLVYLIGMGYWAKKTDFLLEYRSSLSLGGWITVGLIVLILIYLAINFNSLFILFHRIFFEGETWLFNFSDSLIRLFPLEFWRDAFIWVGTLALLGGVGLGYLLSLKRNRS